MVEASLALLIHVYSTTGVVWTLFEYWFHRGGFFDDSKVPLFPMYLWCHQILFTLVYQSWISQEFAVLSVLCNVFHYLVFQLVRISSSRKWFLFRNLQRHHEGHSKDPSTNFGVTTTFWDHFFYTFYFDRSGPFLSDISLPFPLVCGSPMVLSTIGYLIVAIKSLSIPSLWMIGWIYSYTFLSSCLYHTFPDNPWCLRMDKFGVIGFILANGYLVLFHVADGRQQVFFSIVGISQFLYFFWHRCLHGPLFEFYHIIWHFYTALFPLLMLERVR